MRLLEPTAQIWMKIDPYYQQQKYWPMILVYGNMWFMGIFVGVPLCGGAKWEWGWRRRQFFGDLSGYFFGIFRDKASSIIWRHATPYRPVTECKMNDLEWPWAANWRQNPFSANFLARKHVVWRIDRENRSTVATCRRGEETKNKESHKQWYFTHAPRPPTHPDRSHIWKLS